MLVETLIEKGHKFEYDEEKHEYKLDGAVKPSVNQIFDHFGLIKGKQFFRPEHAERGTCIYQEHTCGRR